MKRIGAHVSIAGGIENAPLNAGKIGAKAFAMFTKNQRQWKAPALSPASVEQFRRNCADHGFEPRHILPHDSYLINLGSPEKEKLERSREAFNEEMIRVERLGLTMLNFHPGSHLNGLRPDECLRLIADSINKALEQSENVTAVIENTAGQGSNLGFRFEQLAALIDMTEDKTRIGICLDTCHLHASGYDMGNAEAAKTVFNEFDRTVGMRFLRGMHLNDARHPAGSRLDRHASLGKGTIGLDTFRFIVSSLDFEEIPLILETPDSDIWKEEIAILYSFTGN
ncbi:MAG: deoxyribonuclease IV [Chlorobiaceae bacterium]|nr:deoxyribonuclease IV [Chlorobiaceae bacterium]